jgi:adenine-specific DNA-methyltransferase
MTDATKEQPESFDLNSDDVASRKRADFKKLFPEVFSEDKIDLDQLRRVLGDWVDEGTERFGLTWPGKAACMKVIQAPATGALCPDRGESVNFDESKNVFIEGDNLEVLKLLQKAYFGRIKAIYIDPPYNTGKEFIYPDKYAENLETYLKYTGQIGDDGLRFSTNSETEGRFHSRWLNMMYPRLYVARQILSEDGVIMISIGPDEMAHLHQVLDQIFGRENLVGVFAVETPNQTEDKLKISNLDHLIIYAKSIEDVRPNFRRKDQSARCTTGKPSQSQPEIIFPKGIEVEGVADGVFGDTEKVGGNEDISLIHGTLEVREGKLAQDVTLKARWSNPNDIKQYIAKMKSGSADPIYNKFGKELTRLWFKGPRFQPQMDKIGYDLPYSLLTAFKGKGGKALEDRVGDHDMDYPKHPDLIREVVGWYVGDGETVIDFFAGSATTGEAVAVANSKDGKDRRYILVQLPEISSEYFGSVAEMARERLAAAHAELNGGYRAFKLTKSNFLPWVASSEENVEDLITKIERAASSIPEVEDENILFELLLKDGFELTTKVDEADASGSRVYSVADGALLICLERNLTKEIIDALADLADEKDAARVVCLDAGFQGNDQLKTNAVQTFKSRLGHGEDGSMFRTV